MNNLNAYISSVHTQILKIYCVYFNKIFAKVPIQVSLINREFNWMFIEMYAYNIFGYHLLNKLK